MNKRDPNLDEHKSIDECRNILKNNMLCSIPGCNEQLTMFEGVGSNSLCREHQLKDTDCGGMGRLDRPHTYHRDWICTGCGYDVREDPRIKAITDPILKDRAMRMYMHGDHIVRRADGGDDSADIINALCTMCHNIKTATEEDWKIPQKEVDLLK